MTIKVVGSAARFKGGPGSGHRGHSGRPGKRGGSLPGTGGVASVREAPVSPRKGGMTANTSSTSTIDRKAEDVLNDKASEYCDSITMWDNCGRTARGKIKDGLITELAERSGLEYDEVNKMVKQWSYSSNDTDMRSLSIQQAASEELGVPLSDWQKRKIQQTLDTRYGEGKEGLYPREKERRFVRAVYDYTQEILANAGYGPDDTIRMFRAVGSGGAGEAISGSPQRGKTYKYNGNAIESWSISKSAASPFGQYIFSADIPVRNIVASAVSGQGCFTEAEYLVAGSMGGEAHLTESRDW